MSGFFRVQATLNPKSGIPADRVTNVFHFDSDQTFAEDADDVAARVAAFYDSIGNVTFPTSLEGTGHIKVYDLADPQPREPGVELDFDFVTSSGSTLIPPEIAICASMNAAVGSGDNAKRRRGRVFIGPIWQNALEVTGAGQLVFVKNVVMDTIADALRTLARGPDAGDGRLAVFSPTTAGPEPWSEADLAPAFNDVVEVHVDNAPDVVRSRGVKPTTRVTFAVP